jgi:hypothetical protein
MLNLRMRRLYGIGLVLFVVALPFKTGGCGNTACLTVTAVQLAQNNGTCPAATAASQLITGQACNSVSLEGPGELDGMLCCYPVNDSTNGSCIEDGVGSFSTGDALPPGDGEGEVEEASASTGCGPCCGTGGCSSGTGGSCATCLDVLLNGVVPPSLCDGISLTAFEELETCACTSGASCAQACGMSLCDGMQQPPDAGCVTCLGNSATSGCAAAVMNCQQN